jgi:hypothetical protein
MFLASFSLRWWMYWTARDRIAPLAFSPEPFGTIRPSSLMPSLMFPRRRRSTSFCAFQSRQTIQIEHKNTGYTNMIILSLSTPLIASDRRTPATSSSASRARCRRLRRDSWSCILIDYTFVGIATCLLHLLVPQTCRHHLGGGLHWDTRCSYDRQLAEVWRASGMR